MKPDLVHASAVAIGGRGILIRGDSGAGKSSLVLSILHAERGRAELVADDWVEISRREGRIIARPPAALAGLLEVRGQGIFARAYRDAAQIDLVADLAPAAQCERVPEADQSAIQLLDVSIPRIYLAVGAADGSARIAFALEELDVPSRIDV